MGYKVAEKGTRIGIELLRALVNGGKRIFTTEDARAAAGELGMSQGYVVEALHHLKCRCWIRAVKRGVYAITEESGFSSPPHDYEVALALVPSAVVSHWTALYHHHLTQQMPQTIFCLAPTGAKIPGVAKQSNYQFVHVKRELLFGYDEVWIGEGRVRITDPERTLLDGLRQPQYCGGIQEVLGAFDAHWPSLDDTRIINYALRLGSTVVSRLGWVMKQHGYEGPGLAVLKKERARGVRRLDVSGPDRGPIDRDWRIRANIGV